jgi:hypothetical protein
VRASLACFVPKAHTPFQWRPQSTIAELESKRKFMQSRRIKNVKLSFHDSQTSVLEGVIARGDRRLAPVIHRAWQNGCKFDGWSEYFQFETWATAFKACQIDPAFYVERQRPYTEILPWDFIDTGVSKDYLYEENELAAMASPTPDCRQAGCLNCGICPAFGVDLDIKEEG